MSQRPETQERVRSLARQHPGWTPSQLAIFLQGEGVKITSDDVRRTLARPAPGAEGEEAAPNRYAAPREEPRRSALPVGLLFGVLALLSFVGALFVEATVEPGVGGIASLVSLAVVLLVAGAMGSRRFASGALSGLLSALVCGVLLLGLAALGIGALADAAGGLETLLGNVDLSPDQIASSFLTTAAIILGVLALAGLLLGWLGAKLFGRRKRRATFG